MQSTHWSLISPVQCFFIPYKKGTPVYYHTFDTPQGKILLFTTKQGICGLHFFIENLATHLHAMEKQLGIAPIPDAVQVTPWWQRVQSASGRLPLVIQATPFQEKVWRALCAIPAGETRSYHAIATQLGQEKASRAVARACAHNQIACLIPCHRVIRTDRSISGYRWSIDKKRELLQAEA